MPSLILPGRTQRPQPRMTSREFGMFVPPEALFPGLEATEATTGHFVGYAEPRRRAIGLRASQYGR